MQQTSYQENLSWPLLIIACFAVSLLYMVAERFIAPHTQPGVIGFLGWIIAILATAVGVSYWTQRHIREVRDGWHDVRNAVVIAVCIGGLMLVTVYTVFN